MILCMIVIQKEFEEQHRLEKAKKKRNPYCYENRYIVNYIIIP